MTARPDLVRGAGPSRGYAYGDSPVAIRRLLLLAELFEPCTSRFLGRLPLEEPSIVLDLGCGPGETTNLLHGRFPSAKTTGLDSSPDLIETARARQLEDLSFALADVSTGMLAGGPADLIFARLLLAHLPEPTALAASWAAQLRPGGVLALEEVSRIVTDDRLFTEYLELSTAPLADRRTNLFVGDLLAQMAAPSGCRLTSETCVLNPDSSQAALVFALNLQTLRADAAVRARRSEEELDAIASALEARANGSEPQARIAWEMRQIVIARRS